MEFSDDAEETFKNALELLQVRCYHKFYYGNPLPLVVNYWCSCSFIGSFMFILDNTFKWLF